MVNRGKLISVPMAVSLIASNQNILFLKYFMKDSIDQINLSEPERMVCLVSI